MTQENGNKEDGGLVSDDVKNLLRKLLEDKAITDYHIEIKPGSVKGDNYLGIIAKVDVTGKDSNGEDVFLDYIIKSAPKSEGFRSMAPIRLAYEREIYMYNTILPEFIQFQEQRRVKNPFESFAKCLRTSFEDKDEALIMVDMKSRGFIMQNRRLPLSYPYVRLVIMELAKFHAFSFALKDQKPEVYDTFSEKLDKNFMSEMDKEQMDKHSDMIYDRARKSLDPIEDAEALERYNNYVKTIPDDILTLLSPKEATDCAIVRHGDCWTNNFLFAYDDKENPSDPTRVCFLDWQISCMGSPVLDLLYFIYSCTDKKLRDQHFDQLLKFYHDQMRTFLQELGTDIEKYFPFSVLQEHMLKFGKYGLAVATMLLHLMTSEADEVPNMNEVFEGSESDMIEAFSFESKNKDYYHTRIRDVILHQIEKNYI